MKKIAFIILAVFFATILIPANLQAQEELVLTEEEKADFTEHIGNMLEGFLINLSRIGSKDVEATVKRNVITQTLKLFLNNGESGYDLNNKLIPAPRMQVSSLRNGQVRTNRIPIKQYLSNLSRIGYSKVIIEQAETLYLGKLVKVGDRYETTATYFQYFRGENGDGRIVYEDYTKKTIRIYVQVEEVLGEKTLVARFGDVDVKETTR